MTTSLRPYRCTLVVPCYNEEQRLNVGQFTAFAESDSRLRFILVNDGSTDNTLSVLKTLEAAKPEVFSICNLPKNQGKAEAVRQGFLAAFVDHPDYIGYWD